MLVATLKETEVFTKAHRLVRLDARHPGCYFSESVNATTMRDKRKQLYDAPTWAQRVR
jgi:hypothetical protein